MHNMDNSNVKVALDVSPSGFNYFFVSLKAHQYFIQKRITWLQRLWGTLIFIPIVCFKLTIHIFLIFNVHMAMQLDHRKLWGSKEKKLSLCSPMPLPTTHTVILQCFVTHVGDKVIAKLEEPGCAVACGARLC